MISCEGVLNEKKKELVKTRKEKQQSGTNKETNKRNIDAYVIFLILLNL